MKRKAPPRRSDCPISYALDFVGDKWTLIVLRDLMMSGKRYFREFLGSAEGIASNILTSRLKLLEAAGMVTRRLDPEHARQVIYAPTAKALDLLPSMLELMRWSMTYDARSAAAPRFVKRMLADRDGFIAEIRARHPIRPSANGRRRPTGVT